jgi:hypothetical protein
MVQMDIIADDGHHYRVRIPNVAHKRGYAILRLPADFGKKTQAAVYEIQSLPAAGATTPAPAVRTFGLGAGEKAVGSVAIDQLTFQRMTAALNKKESFCGERSNAASCFNQRSPDDRATVISLYLRLKQLGLWHHVVHLNGVWNSVVGGMSATVRNHHDFFEDALDNVKLCVDEPEGALLHPGTTSMREISTVDSLHITVGPGNHVSLHIDSVSPTSGRKPGGRCEYDPTRSAAHIGREVIPLGIPGLQIFPEQQPNYFAPDRTPATTPDIVRWSWRF